MEITPQQSYRVVLICNFQADRQESILRYGEMLFESLKDRGIGVSMVQPSDTVFSWAGKMPRSLTKWIGYIDKFILFPRKLTRLAATQAHDTFGKIPVLYHIVDHGNAPYLTSVRDQPHVITCHDALAIRSALGEIPENHTKWTGRILQNWILQNLKRSGMVACVSAQTEKELQQVGQLAPGQTAVIPHALNYPYKPISRKDADAILEPLWGEAGPPASYFFHVGGTQWYKNREGLIDIFAGIKKLNPASCKLVLAGKPNTPEIDARIQNLGLSEDVIYVGEVTCEELNALYARAEALLFPSLAEGFGWPIIEAQAAGCPVFTSGAMPMSEIGGDAAGYFDPRNTEEAARKVIQGLRDRPGMVKRSLLNSTKYSRAAMVESYLALYESVVRKWTRRENAR